MNWKMKIKRIAVVSYSGVLIVIGVYVAVQGIFYRDSLMYPFSNTPWLMLPLGFIFIAGGILNMGKSSPQE